MAVINKLILSFNYDLVDKYYDFYLVTTSDKYIKSGAYILDKPLDLLKAESVVFDNGRTMFIMFKKNTIKRLDLINIIEDEKLSLKQVFSKEIKEYILFRLFLFSLNNFSSNMLRFNNIAGKFYIYDISWMDKKMRFFKALEFNVDKDLYLSADACSFSSVNLFPNKIQISEYPRYSFSFKSNCLKRVLHPENSDVFIKKACYGRKAEITFLDLSKNKIENNKSFYVYKVLDLLEEKFNSFLNFKFQEIEILKTIDKTREEKIENLVHQLAAFKNINLVNWSNDKEYEEEFKEIVGIFSEGKLAEITENSKIVKDAFNVIYLHSKEYYEQNNYNDPYKKFLKDEVIQHLTVEDSADKIVDNNKAIYTTILKELLIKDDLIHNKKISLDNWESFNFEGDYIFGKEKDGVHYFIIVKKDGTFVLSSKINDLSSFDYKTLNKLSDYLTINKGKEKTVISNPSGDIIVISRTQGFTLPKKELFKLESVGRDKDSRREYLSGITDINLYNFENSIFYNVGVKGQGMQTSVPKASHLYKVDVIQGRNFIDELLETMAVTFVKYKSFTVLPYPIKYLNEFILLNEKEKQG